MSRPGCQLTPPPYLKVLTPSLRPATWSGSRVDKQPCGERLGQAFLASLVVSELKQTDADAVALS